MSDRYPGGIITKTPVVPAGPYEDGAAPGIWTLEQQAYYAAQGIWPIAGNTNPGDPYYKYVTMLLNGDGTNGGQNNTFLDSSTNAFSITRNGNTTQGSFSPYGSLWSNYFNGSSRLRPPSNTAFSFGTGDFTIEFWFYPNSNDYAPIFAIGDPSASTNVQVLCFADGGGGNTTKCRLDIGGGYTEFTGVPTVGQWNHIAVTRSGTTCRYFINGTSIGSTTSSATITSGDVVIGGGSTTYNQYMPSGYLSNVRVNKGTALYTANFTPSTTPLTAVSGTSLLTCQSNRFIDNSSNAFAITVNGTPSVQRFSPFNPTASYTTATIGGSGYWDGTGDSLYISDNSAFNLATGDFTIEGWFYPLTNGYLPLITKYTTGGDRSWVVGLSSGSWEILTYGSSNVNVYAGSTPSINSWHHFALERNGSNFEFFVDGVRLAQVGSQDIQTSTAVIAVGNYGTGYNYPFNGYLSNFRIVKGTAVYSGSTYTVPTAPLTAITNTSLLCSMTNASIPDYAMMNDLETVGNAQVSTSVKKFGTGSIAFDGDADYLVTVSKPSTETGTGDFTIEGWAYIEAFGDPRPIFCLGDSDLSSGIELYVNTSSAAIIRSGGTTRVNGGTNSLTSGSWKHFAVVRNSGSVYLYVDGVAKGTAWASSTNFTGNMYIGCDFQTAVTYMFYGYIDDLRITKGYARYTTTFTPPTSAFYTY